MINYYEVLEVSEKASDEIIEKAYKVLAKKYHPDLQQGADKKIAEEKMKTINEAYEILSSKEKREEYDKKLLDEREQNTRKNAEQQNIKNNYENQNDAYEKEKVNHNYKNQNDAYEKEKVNHNYKNEKYTQEQKNINNYYQEQMRMQREYQERLEREARIRYTKAYENYLRSLGYKIKHRWTWDRVKALLLTIIVMIVISAILWWIPYSREFLIKLYQENFAIKLIVDLISNVLESLISILKK